MYSRSCDFIGRHLFCYVTVFWSEVEGYIPIWEYVFRLVRAL